MKARRRTAIELLLCHPDTTVAEMIGVRLSTLRAWMRDAEFAEALRQRETEQQSACRRIARQAVLNSAAMLCQLVCDLQKLDAKLLVDVLKASGAFETDADDAGAALTEIMERAKKNVEQRHAQPE